MNNFSWQNVICSIREILASDAVKSAQKSLKTASERLCGAEKVQTAASKVISSAQHWFSYAKESAARSEFSADLKRNARSALLNSLRTVGSLCTAGADRLEQHTEPHGTERLTDFGRSSGTKPQALHFAAGNDFFRKTPRRQFISSSSSHYRSGRRFPAAALLAAAAAGILAGGLYYYYTRQNSPVSDSNTAVIAKLQRLPQPDAERQKPQNAASEERSDAPQVRIKRSGVNLRDGHSLKGTKILAKMDAGMAELLEKWQDQNSGQVWYKIRSAKGTGWVSGRYADELKPEKEIEPGVTQGFLKGTRINVRDGHSTQGTQVLTQLSNQTVTLLERWRGENDAYPWYRIRFSAGEGWVYGRYVEVR